MAIRYNDNKKIRSITPTEQKVYFNLLKFKVARTSDLLPFVSDNTMLIKVLSSLVKKGFLLRVFKGLYAAVPPEFIEEGFEVDRYLLASKVHTGEYSISHHSALELHGVSQSHFSKVFISIDRSKKKLEFQDVRYQFIYHSKIFGVKKILRGGMQINVTDREKTLLDCIRRPKYSGGLEEMLKSISNFTTVDHSTISDHLARFNERSLYQRTGFILHLLQDELDIPIDLLLELKGYVGKRCYYLDESMKKGQGRLDARWNVIVPHNIGELLKVV